MIFALLYQLAIPQNCGENHEHVTCILNNVAQIVETWYARGLDIAGYIFFSFVALELVVTGYSVIRKKGDLGDVMQITIIKMLGLGLIWLLIQFSQVWLGSNLMDAPVELSGAAAMSVIGEDANVTPPTPASLISMALTVVTKTFESIPEKYVPANPMDVFSLGLLPSFLLMIVSVITAAIFLRFAVELFKTIIECYLVTGGGIVLVGFFAFRGSAPIAEGILLYIVQVTIKMFFLILAAFLCLQLTTEVLNLFQDYGSFFGWENLTSVLADKLLWLDVFAMCIMLMIVALTAHVVMEVPSKIAQMVSSRLTINIKGFLESM